MTTYFVFNLYTKRTIKTESFIFCVELWNPDEFEEQLYVRLHIIMDADYVLIGLHVKSHLQTLTICDTIMHRSTWFLTFTRKSLSMTLTRYNRPQRQTETSIHDCVHEGVVDHWRFCHKIRNFSFARWKQMIAPEDTHNADHTVRRPTKYKHSDGHYSQSQ